MIDDVTVIGDVHGCFKTLVALLDKIPEEHKKRICFAGDLVDRGPRSREVVQFVIDGGYDCVMGNHELMMSNWKNNHNDMMWLGNGGNITLDSYYENDFKDQSYLKGEFNKEVFEEHQKWMLELPIVQVYPNVKTPENRYTVVSHSICHNYWKSLNDEDENRSEMAKQQIPWNRNFHKIKDQGFFNVIGHTPDENNPHIKTTYANIDTGAFCGYGSWKRFKNGGLGKLTALHVPTMTIYQQECIDDDENIQYFD